MSNWRSGWIIGDRTSAVAKAYGAKLYDAVLPGRRVRQAFRDQARACAQLGSPFTALLLSLAAERLDTRTHVGQLVLNWPGGAGRDALALRFAGALHALVLSDADPELTSLYPPNPMPDPERLWQAVERALYEHGGAIMDTLASPPQTNEVARSGILLGGFLEVAKQSALPLRLSEVGASCGFNLCWDQLRYRIGDQKWGAPTAPLELSPEWRGGLPDLNVPVEIADRQGCDRNPLSPRCPVARKRLLSYVWPDQTDRMRRLSAILDLAARTHLSIDQADAADWVEQRLEQPVPGTAHVIYHTIVWQYLPQAARDRIRAALNKAGEKACTKTPLAWLRFEADGEGEGGLLALTYWPGGTTVKLARADYHGRWVRWLQ
ncbi:DUF2332 domain-containing protein [Rhodoligotrophos ferricapiens]|uniref:DUF2332 domain-containing protein n=1 Tax=Rhodoligotrophos ferricapiens TaxID=3069264 RepID=UPI00315C506F